MTTCRWSQVVSLACAVLLGACGGGTASPATSSNPGPAGVVPTPSPEPSIPATFVPNHGAAAIDLRFGVPALKVGMAGDNTDPPPRFVPAEVTVHAGDIVEWDYSPTAFVPHNVVFRDAADLSSRPLGGKPDGSPGVGRWQVRFTAPGIYRYICTFHLPTMIGSVAVT